ncbi:hypothetical protein [Poriferisphaera corsica]|nr:hypothetical protein [Poriferisphaera corsica]
MPQPQFPKYHKTNLWILSVLAVLTFVATGCSQYQLAGRVIEGPNSYIAVVDQNDPRLNAHQYGGGVANTQISVTLDPNDMRPIHEGTAYSDLSGNFSLPINAQGAGFLMYEAQVTAIESGHMPTQQEFALPSASKRILVVLKSGEGKLSPKTNLIEETLKMGEPYMR